MNYKEIFVAVNSAALMLSTVSCGAKEEAVPKYPSVFSQTIRSSFRT